MEPKYKPGDILYYVDPFVFVIDRVMVQFSDPNIEAGLMYYIDDVGAYLLESNLTPDLPTAKGMALMMMNKFIDLKQHEIWNANPQYHPEEGA